MYAIKLGLQTAADKKKSGLNSKLTVSNAQRKQIDEANKAKRARDGNNDDDDDEEEEEEDDSGDDKDGEPSRKKGKKNVESDDGERARPRVRKVLELTKSLSTPKTRWRKTIRTMNKQHLTLLRRLHLARHRPTSSSSRAFLSISHQTCSCLCSNSKSACATRADFIYVYHVLTTRARPVDTRVCHP